MASYSRSVGQINDARPTSTRVNRAIAGLVFLFTGSVYLLTVAPTFSFWDCGEFVACSHTLGIAHPPGSPLYLAIGRLFAVLPFGSDIAWRINLLSALSSALAAMFGYLIVQRLVSSWDDFSSKNAGPVGRAIPYLGGIIGATALAFGQTAWANAVEAEVYGLTMALFLAVLYLVVLALGTRSSSRRVVYLLVGAYLMTLGLGVHMTVFLAAPALALTISLTGVMRAKHWLALLLFVVGMLYLVFALSSRSGEVAFYIPLSLLSIVFLFHTLSIRNASRIHYYTGALLLASLFPLYMKFLGLMAPDNALLGTLADLTVGELATAGLILWGLRQVYLLLTKDGETPAPGRIAAITYTGVALLALLTAYFVRGYVSFLILGSLGGVVFVFYFKDKLNWLALAAGAGIALAIIGFWEFVLGTLSMIIIVSLVDLMRDRCFSTMLKLFVGGTGLIIATVAYIYGPDMLRDSPEVFVGLLGALALALILFRSRAGRPDWRVSVAALVLALAGFSSNVFVPVRSARGPLINENNPSQSTAAFVGYFERKQYGSASMVERMFKRRAEWINQFGEFRRMGFWGFFRGQYGLTGAWFAIPLALGVFGIWEALRRSPAAGTILSITLLVSVVGLILYMNFADGTRMVGDRDYLEVRNRDYFFTPGFMLFALAIGCGAAAALQSVRESLGKRLPSGRGLQALLALLALGALATPALALKNNYRVNDRSANYIPFDYGYNLLSSAAPNAILVTAGDNDTFPLWALQSVYGLRRDVAVLNLSLANTNWYLKQMRDNWDLPLYMSDKQIDGLRVRRMPDGRIVRIQEQILDILLATRGTHGRPVQFSITVPSSRRTLRGKGLDSSLTLVGRVYELRDDRDGPLIDIERTDSLHSNEYLFRSLGDNPAPQDAHSMGITNSYATVFMRMTDTLEKAGDIDAALRQLDRASEILPHFRPLRRRRVDLLANDGRNDELARLFTGDWTDERSLLRYWIQILSERGQSEELQRLFDGALAEDRAALRYWVQLARRAGRNDEAIAALRLGVQRYAGDRQMLFGLLALELEIKKYDSMRVRLRDWIDRHPADSSARALLGRVIETEQSADSAN